MNSRMETATLPASEAPENEITFANARLVLEEREITGTLTIQGQTIADICETGTIPPGAIDCQGDYILPGLVELHTDNLERHIEPRPRVAWPHKAALVAHDAELASTGITTVFDAMRVGSIPSGKGNYRKYAREVSRELLTMRTSGALKISHFLHLRAEVCSETLIEEMAEFGPDDRVGIVSLMDHTPGQRQFRDFSKFKSYIMGRNGFSEDEFLVHMTKLKSLRERLGDAHEAKAVEEAGRYGAVLASHDDTTAGQVATSAGHGIRLAEFPTTIEAAEACRDASIAVMMGAPNIIRGGSHSGNVSALDLAERGLLDIISSDYIPSALLLAAFRLASLWDDLPRAIRTVTLTPARAAHLQDRGALATGLRADLIRVSKAGETHLIREVWSQGRRVG